LLSFPNQEHLIMQTRNHIFGVLFLIGMVSVGILCNTGAAGPKIPMRMPPTPFPPFTPQVADTSFNVWLSYDAGSALYYFPLPDQWDDHYYNVRFSNPDSCRLLRAAFLFRRVPGDTIPPIMVSRDINEIGRAHV
jgi:hypothetical protein